MKTIEKELILEIPVICRTQDNGDGGYSIYVYNNEDELIEDHPRAKKFAKVDEKWIYVPVELSEEEIEGILDEDAAYENGYIENSTIKIKVVNGVASLSEKFRFSAGQ
jgi:hypothetical protein